MVIDTMIVAYALLNEPDFGPDCILVLRTADELVAPSSIEAELLNALWQWTWEKVDPDLAESSYMEASGLWTELIPVESLWKDAFKLAIRKNHSPYDTLFIVAARHRKTKVLTYDKKLLKLFPDDTMTAKDYLATL